MMTEDRPRRLKDLRIEAGLRQRRELMIVRPMLEELVRLAYPQLSERCLCSRCLMEALQHGAGQR